MMKRTTFISLLLLLATVALASGKADKTALKLTELLNGNDPSLYSDSALDQKMAPLKALLSEKEYIQVRSGLRELIKKAVNDPDLKIALAKNYQRHFSTKEMEELIEIYQSPALKKFMKLGDELSVKKNQLVQEITDKKYKQEIIELMKQTSIGKG